MAFGAAKLFGVSFALGAFFAGMVMGESNLSQQATEEALPLRDAFAVLFFVSVGMLLNPTVFVDAPLAARRHRGHHRRRQGGRWPGRSCAPSSSPTRPRSTVAAGRAQIGEFSFILIGLGIELELVPPLARDLVLAGAIISIVLNPLIFALLVRRPHPEGGAAATAARNRRRRRRRRTPARATTCWSATAGSARWSAPRSPATAPRWW